MPKKDSMVEKRKWLEAYEAGTSQAAIASGAKRDIRTIKRGIEEARRERVQSLARMELVKEALHNHNKSLLSVVQESLSTLGLPASNQPAPWRGVVSDGSITVDGGKAKYENLMGPKVTEVTLNVEHTTEWDLLREHLNRDPFLEALNRWKRELASHLEARMIMKQQLAGLLRDKTGLEFAEESASGSFLYYSSVDALLQQLIQMLPKLTVPDWFEDMIIIDFDRGDIRYGQASALAHAPGTEQECKKHILEATNEVLEYTEADNLSATYKAAQQLADKARKAGEEILMMGLVPGQCRICRRLGV